MLFQLRKTALKIRDVIFGIIGFKHRVAILVDGFNLYHSLDDASRRKNKGDRGTKWLDIRSYAENVLPSICKNGRLHGLYYFSALATHRIPIDPDTIVRHNAFIDALKSTGFRIELGRFKKRRMKCHHCKVVNIRHEEKETDVSISVKLLELAVYDHADTIVIMSGDTDLVPAINAARRLAPEKRFFVLFPHGRHNNELVIVSDGSILMKYGDITSHQFPNVIFHDGETITKPLTW